MKLFTAKFFTAKYFIAILTVSVGIFAAPLFQSDAHAADAKIGAISITSAWARASTGGRRPSAAYLTLKNTGADDVLTGITSPAAEKVQIHQSLMEDGVMKMRSAEPLPLPAGATVRMKPGGYHIMLMRLTRPFKKGDEITLTLTFKKGGVVTLQVPVQHAGATSLHDVGAMKHKSH